MPNPSLLHPEPLSLRQSTADTYLHRRCSNTVLSQSLWDPWVPVHTRPAQALEPLWWEWGPTRNANSPLLPSCWGFAFALGHGVSPHSRCITYHLTGVSLTLDMGYLLTATGSRAAQLLLDKIPLEKGITNHFSILALRTP